MTDYVVSSLAEQRTSGCEDSTSGDHLPDLSHLTPAERQIIEKVMMRKAAEDEKEAEVLKRQQDEVVSLENAIRQRNVEHQKMGGELEATCQICLKTKFADGIGHTCKYCFTRCCARCGGKVTLRSNKNIWVCILCRKKQELLIKTGEWIHSSMATKLKQIEESSELDTPLVKRIFHPFQNPTQQQFFRQHRESISSTLTGNIAHSHQQQYQRQQHSFLHAMSSGPEVSSTESPASICLNFLRRNSLGMIQALAPGSITEPSSHSLVSSEMRVDIHGAASSSLPHPHSLSATANTSKPLLGFEKISHDSLQRQLSADNYTAKHELVGQIKSATLQNKPNQQLQRDKVWGFRQNISSSFDSTNAGVKPTAALVGSGIRNLPKIVDQSQITQNFPQLTQPISQHQAKTLPRRAMPVISQISENRKKTQLVQQSSFIGALDSQVRKTNTSSPQQLQQQQRIPASVQQRKIPLGKQLSRELPNLEDVCSVISNMTLEPVPQSGQISVHQRSSAQLPRIPSLRELPISFAKSTGNLYAEPTEIGNLNMTDTSGAMYHSGSSLPTASESCVYSRSYSGETSQSGLSKQTGLFSSASTSLSTSGVCTSAMVMRNDSLGSDPASECVIGLHHRPSPPISNLSTGKTLPRLPFRKLKLRDQHQRLRMYKSLSSSEDEVRSTPELSTEDDFDMESECISEPRVCDVYRKQLKPDEILDAKMRNFLAHPINWKLTIDGQSIIGHMILKKHQTNDPMLGSSAAILGLKVVGGRVLETGGLGALIEKVKKGSIADTIARLKPGDEILRWNSIVLKGKTHDEVHDIIADSKQDPQVELLVSRPTLKRTPKLQHQQATCYSPLITKEEFIQQNRIGRRHTDVIATPTAPLNYDKSVLFRGSSLGAEVTARATPGLSASSRQTPHLTITRSTTITGRLQIKIWYDSQTLELMVMVLGALELPPRRTGLQRNAYVKLFLLPDRSENSAQQTRTVINCNEPIWNQTFLYAPLSRQELKSRAVELTIWDYDRYNSNEFLGQVLIELANISLSDDGPEWHLLMSHEEIVSQIQRHQLKFYSHNYYEQPQNLTNISSATTSLAQQQSSTSHRLSPASTLSRLSDSDISELDFDDDYNSGRESWRCLLPETSQSSLGSVSGNSPPLGSEVHGRHSHNKSAIHQTHPSVGGVHHSKVPSLGRHSQSHQSHPRSGFPLTAGSATAIRTITTADNTHPSHGSAHLTSSQPLYHFRAQSSQGLLGSSRSYGFTGSSTSLGALGSSIESSGRMLPSLTGRGSNHTLSCSTDMIHQPGLRTGPSTLVLGLTNSNTGVGRALPNVSTIATSSGAGNLSPNFARYDSLGLGLQLSHSAQIGSSSILHQVSPRHHPHLAMHHHSSSFGAPSTSGSELFTRFRPEFRKSSSQPSQHRSLSPPLQRSISPIHSQLYSADQRQNFLNKTGSSSSQFVRQNTIANTSGPYGVSPINALKLKRHLPSVPLSFTGISASSGNLPLQVSHFEHTSLGLGPGLGSQMAPIGPPYNRNASTAYTVPPLKPNSFDNATPTLTMYSDSEVTAPMRPVFGNRPVLSHQLSQSHRSAHISRNQHQYFAHYLGGSNAYSIKSSGIGNLCPMSGYWSSEEIGSAPLVPGAAGRRKSRSGVEHHRSRGNIAEHYRSSSVGVTDIDDDDEVTTEYDEHSDELRLRQHRQRKKSTPSEQDSSNQARKESKGLARRYSRGRHRNHHQQQQQQQDSELGDDSEETESSFSKKAIQSGSTSTQHHQQQSSALSNRFNKGSRTLSEFTGRGQQTSAPVHPPHPSRSTLAAARSLSERTKEDRALEASFSDVPSAGNGGRGGEGGSKSYSDQIDEVMEQLNANCDLSIDDLFGAANSASNSTLNASSNSGERRDRKLRAKDALAAQGLTKKSNSTSQLSVSGTKKRLGFRKKQATSFSVHRSEEVLPEEVRHLVKQYSSVSSDGETASLSGDSSVAWMPNMRNMAAGDTGSVGGVSESAGGASGSGGGVASGGIEFSNFVDGLGPGQVVGRQAVASGNLGEIQISLMDRKGALEVEVVRARGLQAKHGAKMLPTPYVKVYLVRNRKCVSKAKTANARRTLDPLYQQQLLFPDNYKGCNLHVMIWGDYGRIEKKVFMGGIQILLDDLDLSNCVIGWYKLFQQSALAALPESASAGKSAGSGRSGPSSGAGGGGSISGSISNLGGASLMSASMDSFN